MTIYGMCTAVQEDVCGYINYVINVLSDSESKLLGFQNITLVRFPNWDCADIKVNDIGYFEFNSHKAGVDTWYNGKELIPYKYDAVQFVNYIKRGHTDKQACIM